MTIDEVNDRLKVAIDRRVMAHHARQRGTISVATYLGLLRWVRDVEDRLEPLRRAVGYRRSRAYELCTAYTADVYRR